MEILNEGGTDALTFRALAARLATGPGAIYYHVNDKSELLAAAAENVMVAVLDRSVEQKARRGVREVMVRVFDAISAHPWLGTQLAAAPWQPAVLQLFERVGTDLDALGVPEATQFNAASVLVHQVIGVASQYDAGTRLDRSDSDRPAFLESARAALVQADRATDYPFMTRIAQQLANHDDREQFQAGIEIILAGIEAHSAPFMRR